MTKLTLADAVTTRPIFFGGKYGTDYPEGIKAVHRAEKYVFDSRASELIGRAIHDHPELIAAIAPTVRAPHHATWVEVDNRAFWERANGYRGSPAMDARVGYLVVGDDVYCFADGPSAAGAVIWPVAYKLHVPWTDESRARIAGITRMNPDDYLWGSAANRLPPELLGSLADHHSARLLKVKGGFDIADLNIPILKEGSADLRNIVALLGALTGDLFSPTIVEISAKRTFSGGRSVRASAYRSVTHLVQRVYPPRSSPPQGAQGDRRGPVEHRRGSWVHDAVARSHGSAAGCSHAWLAADDFGSKATPNPQRFRCAECGGKRWWRSSIDRPQGGVSEVAV
jgi:hypothetical protein